MFHIGRTKVPVILGTFPLFNFAGNKYDNPRIGDIPEKSLEDETGIDRLKKMFSRDENYEMHPELQNILTTTTLSAVMAGIIGGTSTTKTVVTDFIDKHQETKFSNQFHAKKLLQHEVTKRFLKGFAIWAVKAGLFSAVFLTTSSGLAVYRGHARILDYTIGGALAGSLFKANLGLRAVVAGSIIGGALSTIGSALCFGICSLTGYVFKDHKNMESQFEKRSILRMREKSLKSQNNDVIMQNSSDETRQITNDSKESIQESQKLK